MQAPNWTDFLQCSVCTLKYNPSAVVPVSLSCSHSMCKRCISRLQTKQCPYDKSSISSNLDKFPPNTAFLHLLGYQPEEWSHEMSYLSHSILSDMDLQGYTSCREAAEKLALFLKPHVEQGVVQATASIPRPILKKLISLLSNQVLEGESRGKAVRAAQSIAERIITELLVMHQNQHQLSTALWTTVRNRGCQFLGPVMQEEALKLILKGLENGMFLSRKTIVLYVLQNLVPDFQNASKTNIGHVIQLLYRASCFNVQKIEGGSSLMQLKEEFCTYEALRREHDAQIVKIAMEAGLRISPETWSTLLYGNTSKKSDMQSIIDKLVSLGVCSSGISELIVAIGRSQDQYNLNERLVTHLDTILKLVVSQERNTERGGESPPDLSPPITCSWDTCTTAFNELLICLEVFTDFTQLYSKECPESFGHGQVKSGRYKTGMCPYMTKPGGCPRGALCPYAHTEEERKKYVTMAATNPKPRPKQEALQNLPSKNNTSSLLRNSQPPSRRTDFNTGSLPHRYPDDMGSLSEGSYSSFEHSSSYPGSGGNVLYHTVDTDSTYFVRPTGASMGHTGFYQEEIPTGNYTTHPHTLHTLPHSSHYPPSGGYEGGGDIGGYSSAHHSGRNDSSSSINSTGYMYSPQQSISKPSNSYRHPPRHSLSLDSAPSSTHSTSNTSDYDPPPSYDRNHSNELTVDMATTTSSTDSTPVTTSNFYPPSSQEEGVAITLASDAWKYNNNNNKEGRGNLSSVSGEGSLSDETTEDEKLHYEEPLSQNMVSRGGVDNNEVGVASSKEGVVSTSTTDADTMEELRARVKELELRLNKEGKGSSHSNNISREQQHYSSYQSPSLSHHPHNQQQRVLYYTSPQNTGYIATPPLNRGGGPPSLQQHYGPPPPHTQPPQVSQQYIPVGPPPQPHHQSYYDPFTGLPTQVWCPPTAVHGISPYSTPPNSGLIAVHHMGQTHPPRPVPPNPMIHDAAYMQIQTDETIAHYLAFQEQSKAPMGRAYPIAPGAQLTTPMAPPTPHQMHPPPAMHYGFDFPHVMVPKY